MQKTKTTPAKAKQPLLTKVVSARVPAEVADAWRAAAGAVGLAMSDWLRQAVDRDAVRVVDYRRPAPRRRFSLVDPALLAAIARVGNNLNQTAHVIHRDALIGQRVDALRCLNVLAEIQREISAIALVRSKD